MCPYKNNDENEKKTVGESGDPSNTAGLHINHQRVN